MLIGASNLMLTSPRKRALSLERGHCLLQEGTVPYRKALPRNVREPRECPGERRKS